MDDPCLGEQLFFVVPRELAVTHQYLSIDDDRLHVAGFSAVNELAEKIVYRLMMDRVHVNQNQIRPLTGFDGSAK